MNSSPPAPLATATDRLSAIVVKHTDLVFSVAKRRLGNKSLAEEVTQTVFIRLAHSKIHFNSDAQMVSWLHRTATNAAVDLWRSESRRKAREREAMMNLEHQRDEDVAVMQSLDIAIEGLAGADRDIILRRFFSRQRMREIGQACGISEDAAKMRLSRAVDKLRKRLARAGISCSVAGLTTILTTRTIDAAPAGIASRVCDGIKSSPSPARLPRTGPVLRWAAVGFVAVTCWIFIAQRGDHTAFPEKQNASTASLQRSAATRLSRASELPAREKSTATIVTKVVRAETKEPVAGALVVWETVFDRGSSATGPDGVATLDIAPNTPDRNWQFRGYVFADGFLPVSIVKSTDTSVTNATRREFTAEIETGPSVAGTVVDESGSPVPDVHIFVECPSVENLAYSRDETSVYSDAAGQWSFSAIPKWWSDVSLLLIKDGFAPTLATLSMKDGLRGGSVTIERGKEVIGRVLNADGAPIANAEVTLLWNGARSMAYGIEAKRVVTGLDGAFAFHQVNPLDFMKTLAFEARAAGFVMLHLNATCTNATNTVEFKLEPGGLLKGRIIDQHGQPITAGIHEVGSAGRNFLGAKSHADGRFVWNDAPIDSEFDVYPIFPSVGRQKRVRLRADGSEHIIQIEPPAN